VKGARRGSQATRKEVRGGRGRAPIPFTIGSIRKRRIRKSVNNGSLPFHWSLSSRRRGGVPIDQKQEVRGGRGHAPIRGSKMENSKIREWRHSLPLVRLLSVVPSALPKKMNWKMDIREVRGPSFPCASSVCTTLH
jgi:hypothetical protein